MKYPVFDQLYILKISTYDKKLGNGGGKAAGTGHVFYYPKSYKQTF